MTVHVAELGFCSNFNHENKYAQEQLHYAPLINELEWAGWNVNGQVHAITVGAGATVPERNDAVLKSLGIAEDRMRKEIQRDLV